jgi:hypothetical protein
MNQLFQAVCPGWRVWFAGLLTFFLTLGGEAPVRGDFIIASIGQNKQKKVGVAGLNLLSTGTSSVYTTATGNNVTVTNQNPKLNGAADQIPTPTPVNIKTANGDTFQLPGIGATADKFDARGRPATQTYESTSRAPAAKGARVVSKADADFSGTVAGMNRGSSILVAAGVNELGNVQRASGLAAAEARDPEVYRFSAPGSFTYEFSLGNSDITIDPVTGLSLPSLSLQSDTLEGSVHYHFAASFQGVSVNDQSLDGELFRLVIEGTGVVSSKDDLAVTFLPSPVLGLSSAQIRTVESFVKDRLVPLSGGGVGLAPGTEVPIFGSGGALPTLTLTHGVGQVTYEDSTGVRAEVVPEPSTLVLGATGVLVVTAYGWRRRKQAAAGDDIA